MVENLQESVLISEYSKPYYADGVIEDVRG